jgi:hypothetical protein
LRNLYHIGLLIEPYLYSIIVDSELLNTKLGDIETKSGRIEESHLHSGLQVSWGCQVLGGQSLERGQKGDDQVFKKLIGVLRDLSYFVGEC